MPGLSAHFRDVVSPSRNALAEWLLRAADVGLVGIFFVTALTLGGRHDGGRFVYALSVAFAALTLSWRSVLLGKPIRTPRWPTVLVLLTIAVPIVQLLPLPERWLAMVAPGHAGLLPLWTAEGAIGAWRTISLAPYETFEGLALLLVHAVLFFTVINRVERESDARRLLIGVGIGALVMALIAIAQYTASNGRLLWIYSHPYSRFDGQVQGTFVNRNHLAHYLAFGAAGLTPLLLGGVTRSRRSRAGRHREVGLQQQTGLALGFFALAVVLATILGTMSRGGLVALSSGFAIAVVLRGISGRLRLKEGVALAALATIVLLAVSFFNYDRVTARFSNLVSGQIEELDHGASRRLIWGANLSALAANPWLGHGAGGHRYYYGAYIAQPATKEFTHAESSYLQIASECGIAGLAVLAIAIISFGWWVARGLWEAQTDQQVTLWCALGAGLGISLAHAVVDFVWYLPSLAALVIAFAALAWRLRELQERKSLVAPASESRRFQPGGKWGYGDLLKVSIVAMSVSVALTCLAGPAAGSLKWDKYLRVASSVRAQQEQVIELDGDARANHDASIEDSQRRAAALLSGMLAVDRNNARAHLRYADRCIQAFAYESGRGANPMSIEQIRETFRVGGFDDHAHALAWLDKAIGDSAKRLHAAHLHASLAMRLNPLEARAYLILAELDFLSLNGSSIDVLIDQAIRLRPLDGGLRYAAGRRLHSAGRLDEALEQYRLCLSLPGSHRQQLLMALAPIIPASALLESLQPDGPATEIVFAAYRRLIASEERAGHPDLVAISIHAKQLAEQTDGGSPGELARNWSRLSLLHREIASNDEAVVCAERAYELQPHNFWVRHELGLSLYQAQRYDEADKHLRWCLARRPDLRYLQRMMKLTSRRIGEAERQRQDEVRRELRMASLEEAHDTVSKSSTGEQQNVER